MAHLQPYQPLWTAACEALSEDRVARAACACAGAIGVLQSQMPPRAPAGGFQMSAFGAAAQAPPPMDALEMQLANMQGMPGYGEAGSSGTMLGQDPYAGLKRQDVLRQHLANRYQGCAGRAERCVQQGELCLQQPPCTASASSLFCACICKDRYV